MPRRARIAPGGIVNHALNRGNGRNKLFYKPEDFSAVEAVIAEELWRSVNCGTPYRSADSQMRIAKKLGLEASLHPRSRPRKEAE